MEKMGDMGINPFVQAEPLNESELADRETLIEIIDNLSSDSPFAVGVSSHRVRDGITRPLWPMLDKLQR